MAEESKVSMKLLIDTRRKRALFAEAGKDCVDFLFYLLSLPVSTIINLLGKQDEAGSLANLYQSIETLNDTYIQPNISRDTLLNSVPLLSFNERSTTRRKLYGCSGILHHYSGYRCPYVSDDWGAVCPISRTQMSTELQYVAPPPVEKQVSEGGFVKGAAMYMVMDDLVVKPMSTISSIVLMNKFNIREVEALEERVVTFGMDEGLKLLRDSLQSKKVLTDVFVEGVN